MAYLVRRKGVVRLTCSVFAQSSWEVSRMVPSNISPARKGASTLIAIVRFKSSSVAWVMFTSGYDTGIIDQNIKATHFLRSLLRKFDRKTCPPSNCLECKSLLRKPLQLLLCRYLRQRLLPELFSLQVAACFPPKASCFKEIFGSHLIWHIIMRLSTNLEMCIDILKSHAFGRCGDCRNYALDNQFGWRWCALGVIQDGMNMLSQVQNIQDKPDAVDLDASGKPISFENVCFTYGGEGTVMESLSLDIKPGEKIGLVGRSGAGKTTLTNILLRFYDVEGGSVKIGDQNVIDVKQDSLRANIGMVTQDTSLLHRTIRENIAYSKPKATDEEIIEAAKRANAWEFIQTLVDNQGNIGLDAQVGERGVKLSGGQRQHAPILVLDEATSALDSEVEAAIQESLFKLMEGKTVIAIAHRLSTIAQLDRLVVMDQGAILENGTHDELVFEGVFSFFEGWIDPFKAREDYEPPNKFLGYVWHYVSQVRWAFLALLTYGFVNAIVEAVVFSYVGQLVDILTQFEAQGKHSTGWDGLLAEFGTSLLVMFLVVAILRAIVVTFGALIEEQVIVPGFFMLMRWQSHKHVIGQSLSFFQNDLAGRISQKVFQSGMATGDMMISLLQVIWFVVIYAFTTAGLLLALDWQLGLVIGVWIIAFYAIARFFIPKVRDHARRAAETASGVSGRMVDSYANIQTVKLHGATGQDDFILEAMQTHQKGDLSIYQNADLYAGFPHSCERYYYFRRLLGNLNGFFRNVGVTQNTMDLVAKPHDIRDALDASKFEFKGGEIEFKDVSFHYDKVEGILDGLNLSIKSGEKIGIVGPSGAGKTTLLHLLMRFYDPEKGQVLIDGQDIAKVFQNSLRSQFSFVQQDVQLFHRSVFENISLGVADASFEEVLAAAKLANAHEFILELEDIKGNKGYDVQVGERGVKLSGGQRQRIAIARALFRNAPILVLDEATSQLDSGVEEAIQENLTKLMDGKTVFVVAHRLSTVSKLDRLIVLDKGKVIAEGTHRELISQGGLYADLWSSQTKI
ncbi:putative ABC transporter ATP-binding protein [Nymphon striatum]|nr:putative ABC transporter ATP-binding protein [Nymphon striatum]